MTQSSFEHIQKIQPWAGLLSKSCNEMLVKEREPSLHAAWHLNLMLASINLLSGPEKNIHTHTHPRLCFSLSVNHCFHLTSEVPLFLLFSWLENKPWLSLTLHSLCSSWLLSFLWKLIRFLILIHCSKYQNIS